MTQHQHLLHDSQRGAELVDENDATDETFWLDAGYVGTDGSFIKRGYNAYYMRERISWTPAQ